MLSSLTKLMSVCVCFICSINNCCNYLQLPSSLCATTFLAPVWQLATAHAVTVKRMRGSVQETQALVFVIRLAESSTTVALTWMRSAQEKVNNCVLVIVEQVIVCVCVSKNKVWEWLTSQCV